MRAIGHYGRCVSRGGVRSELPDRDTCSPTSSIGVYKYFLLEMRLLQINVDWSELKLIITFLKNDLQVFTKHFIP